LSRVFESAIKNRQPDADQATIDKQKSKPLRSPMIVTVVARLEENPKIPEIEQMLTAGCAAQHIQLACRTLGFGSIWLTGDNCYDSHVHQALGLDFNERIVGFIYIGTPKSDQRLKKRTQVEERIKYWTSPQPVDFAI
jgi:nitroreductase